jgi:enoyl-CoA hydratase/carnithine racemase
LVQKVVPQEELMQVAMAAAHRLAGLGPLAVRTARSLVKKAQELPLEQALEAEATAFAGLFKGHDQKEGMQAFLQRRKPEFKGN